MSVETTRATTATMMLLRVALRIPVVFRKNVIVSVESGRVQSMQYVSIRIHRRSLDTRAA
jgi:hypothetical protein